MKLKKIVSVFILFLILGHSNSVSSQDQLDYKVMMGYQGWFLAPGDGSNTNNPWTHWFSGTIPDPANLVVDMWPDMSEYTDKFNTNMTYADGSNAQLFSSYSLSTTRKHFEWMRDYNVQGVYLQRFLTAVQTQTSGMFSAKNKVLENVITSAAEYDRKYAVMYDVSGVTDATMYTKIVADWEYLVDTYDILNKPEYVKQNGKPVVAIWGIGFKDRELTSGTSQAIIDYFKTNADPKYRAYVMGGVPEGWNTLSGASEKGADWTAVYNSLDMISPWSVGRYSNNSGADSFKNSKIVPDLAACNTINKDYMPVIWPGFSWLNLKNATLNVTPRNGGQFYWRQAYNAVQAGVKFIYVAMFDEVDEGTAMFKITETKAKLPVQAQDILVPLDIDGVNLPSDWYLKLADQTQKMLDGTIPLTSVIPITPPSVDLYVKAGGNNNGGRTEANAFSTVDAAVAAATDGDRIYIVGAISQTSTVAITKSLTFQGMNTAVITGSTARLFNVTTASKTISFSDITFQSVVVSATTTGGAILNQNVASDLSFTNCIFSNNTAKAAGGALNVTLGNLTITNCRFSNNSSPGNGGAINFTGVNLIISGSVFSENSTTAGNGGAISAVGTVAGVLSVTTSSFSGNSAATSAGTTANGGAISVGNTLRQALISYSTFYNNTADLQGGGLYFTATNATSELKNITCFENKIRFATSDAERGGGIRIEGNRPFKIENSLIYGNLTATLATTSQGSDLGVASTASTLTLTKSLFGVSTTLDANDSYGTSNTAANLISSNLFYDATSGFVKYTFPTPGDASPIDFGTDGKDAGAWDYVVSITSLTSNGTAVITQGCGGSALVITGTNFTEATAVTVNGVAVASFEVDSSTQITATLPAGPIAAGAVVVSTPGGTATSTGNLAVNANVTPTFTQVDPICSGGSLSALPTTSNNEITGTWSPALNNTATTEYTFTPTAGSCVTAIMRITVNLATTTTESVTQSQVGGSYTWPKNNETYTSSGTYTYVDGCNTATLNLTINTGQPGTGATSGNLEGSDSSFTTWNGSAWSDGAPTASIEAIIAGNYSTTIHGAITAKKLTLNSGVLTVNSGNLTVVNELINNAGANAAVFENNANLIQVNAVANTGAITVKRNSNALSRLDYTIWSSPVTNESQFLATFSPLTSTNRFYNYTETTNKYNVILTPVATPFAPASGYLIRMPNDHPASPTIWNGSFSGQPNNGTINKAITYSGSAPFGYNMVGNPYPSTIDADDFITINTSKIENSLYFWRKINNPLDSSTAYAVYNALGSTKTLSSEFPNGTIQVGQGFFVKAKSGATTVSFTNAMRVANNQAQFFKTKQVAQRDRVWLNLTNTAGAFSQALIGYVTDASLGVDMYDAKYFNDSPVALTSIINNEEYTIQGRPAFDPTDVVAFNFKTDAAGDYTIALDQFDGLFASGQDIYLKDNNTGAEIDLKAGAYTFMAAAGVDNARFSLKYQKTLKVDAPAFNENSVRVHKNNGRLFVNSGTVPISNIKVFDMQGRLIAEQKNVKATTTVINNLKATHQVLIVKIRSEDNSLVTKKVVN
jgi:predicted outer membrane repeat protein